jgi:hypothetical protein
MDQADRQATEGIRRYLVPGSVVVHPQALELPWGEIRLNQELLALAAAKSKCKCNDLR